HDAAVVAVPDDLRGQEVKAYVVLQPHVMAGAPPTQQIFEHCTRNLAPFKVPRYLEFVDSLPKTPSEKIAKSELIRAKSDLRVGAYDRVDDLWR
ncbi:AMP-binding enzyme, partial [Staphylococcus aureus]|uniref:AMP-binding enzyme n=1 Tax=Staphylococcus aureus TaxID=1280 RepID=UPI003F7614AF